MVEHGSPRIPGSECENIGGPISGGTFGGNAEEPENMPSGKAEEGPILQHKYLRLIHEANINAIWAFALFSASANPIRRGVFRTMPRCRSYCARTNDGQSVSEVMPPYMGNKNRRGFRPFRYTGPTILGR